MMRLQTYAGFSFLATVTVIYHAFNSRGQFYPAMNYLSTSKTCFVLLLNTGLVIMFIMWQLVKRLFLGRLRESEVERLNEQAWREVMEVLFTITIFRQDFSVTFLCMVTALLLIKALHWLAQKRVEYIETTPSVPMLSHVRIVSFMGFLLALDCLILYSSLKSLIQTRQASVALFFSFEYTILATTTVATFVKYVFYVSDMLMEGQWERKAVYTFYLELVQDLLHLSLYIFFFLVIFANYGVPLHLIRDLYETFRNFRIRVADYMRYRKITSNMNERFPDATAEELNASDATCIICREEMVTAKKLLCGHLFHVHCLRSWLERQHTCPTCRALVVPENGSVASGRQHIIPPDSRQPNSVMAGTSTQVSEGDALGENSSQMQHRARFHAAALAASIYGKSFVYPPANTFAWSSGYALVPQIKEPREAAASGPSQQHQLGGGIGEVATSVTPQQHPLIPYTYPLPSMFLQAAGTSSRNVGSPNFEGSFLRAQESFIQSQIESLQAQLQAVQQQANQSKTACGDADPAVADYKGKAVAASTSDCGHHGETEDANNN